MISERCPLNLSDDELSRWYDDDLPTARMEAIRVHSASCPACRERLAAFAEIGAGLRDLTPPPLDLARLLANLPAASPERAPRPIPLEARRRGPRRSWRVMTGAAGLAAVLLLSLFAGYLFANHGRTRPGAVARATATPSPLFSASDFPLMTSVIAMSSPSDGWAFASKETESNSPVIALHYTGGKWTRVQTDVQGRVEALTMRNANDGWLVGTNIYRYDGRSWKEVVVPRQGQDGLYRAVAATSPSSVWISIVSANASVLHFDGTRWTRQPLPPPAPFKLGNYDITSFAMASVSEGWAVMEGYGQQGATNPVMGLLLHFTQGVWKVDRTCTSCGLSTLALASASDGWVGGGYSVPQGNNIFSVKPLLWRLSNGVWKDAPLPIASTTDSTTPDNSILAVHMLSETQGWLITASIPPNDVYHLENGRWVKIPGVTMPNPFNANANAFAFVSPDEFWAIGEYGISHYRNGAWKNVGSPAMS